MIGRVSLCAALSFALLSVTAVTPAAAASFDCGKASTAYERAVCDNPDLSALDDTLAVSFATAIGGLSKVANPVMRQNQRNWLKFAERACTVDGEPQQADYTEDQVSCLNSLLFNRIRDLEQSRMLNGWRFYMNENFVVLKADQEESGSEFNTVATKIYSNPRIDSDAATAEEFNTFAGNLMASLTAGVSDRVSDVETRLKVTEATGSRITVTINDWSYGHGAAHGNYTITYAHFLIADGRPLVAEDVFAADDWVEPLAGLAQDALKASLGDFMWEDLADSLKGWVADPARWNFSGEGLILQFQPYEVTAYAGGAPTVTIPWGKLEAYTTGSLYGVVVY